MLSQRAKMGRISIPKMINPVRDGEEGIREKGGRKRKRYKEWEHIKMKELRGA